jgi:acyl carrier protein
LAEIWSEVLKLPRVSVEDDFFALGGHSILAIQVMARVRETFECDVPVRHLFETPTIARLAAIIEEKLLADIQGLTEEEAERLSSDSLIKTTP